MSHDFCSSGLGGSMACGGLSGVKLGQRALRDSLQHLFGENTQQLPADIQSLKHCAVVISTWMENRHGQRSALLFILPQKLMFILRPKPEIGR